MKKIFTLFILMALVLNVMVGCTEPSKGDDSQSDAERLLDDIIMNEVVPTDEKVRKSLFTIGDATVYVLADNFEPLLPMYFELEETTVNVETVSGTLSSYVEKETKRDKRQSKFELSSSDVLYYDVHRTKLDYVKLTFFDGESIIGCALFAVECDDKIAYSPIIAVEFPQVDGKNQSITAEHVEAVFADEAAGTLASFKFAENIEAEQATIDRSGLYTGQVTLCGITVAGQSWSPTSSLSAQGAQLRISGVDKKVTVESKDNALCTYTFSEGGKAEVNESKKRFEISTDMILCYSLVNFEKEGFIDHVVVTVYDEDAIIGCAVFSVFMKNKRFSYITEGAVEFPQVDGKNQSISTEVIDAYAEALLS